MWAAGELAELGSALTETIRTDFDAVFAATDEPTLRSSPVSGLQALGSARLTAKYR